MAWRTLTEQDLAATLSQDEIGKYRRSHPDGADPVSDLLSRTAELVRAYCRANRSVRVPASAGLVPESLVSPAMDYAAFDVLKRLPLKVGEDRRKARDDAVALLEAVAAGRVTPESADDELDAAAAGSPAAAPASPPRLLD